MFYCSLYLFKLELSRYIAGLCGKDHGYPSSRQVKHFPNTQNKHELKMNYILDSENFDPLLQE